MKKWIIKAVVQKVISYFPYSYKINFFFQKYITCGVCLTDEYFEDKLLHAYKHLLFYREIKGNEQYPARYLELGTGWYPVVPLCFWLNGSEDIFTVDISPLLSKKALLITLNKFFDWYQKGILEKYLVLRKERMEIIKKVLVDNKEKSLNDLLKIFNMTYIVGDASKIKIKNIDFVTSNNVLEHIYPQFLIPILENLYFNVLREGGIMSHFIDMSDHFAHADKSINIYNFLKFSDAQWKWIDNTIQPQNRLRLKEYEILFKSINIPFKVNEFRKGEPELLKGIRINERFLKFSTEEMAISHAYVVSKK